MDSHVTSNTFTAAAGNTGTITLSGVLGQYMHATSDTVFLYNASGNIISSLFYGSVSNPVVAFSGVNIVVFDNNDPAFARAYCGPNAGAINYALPLTLGATVQATTGPGITYNGTCVAQDIF